MKLIALAGFALCFLGCAPAFCAPPTAEERQKIIESLKWQTEGTAPLEEVAAIRLQKGFRYLDSNDAGKVLTDLWNNPRHHTLGMLFPPDEPGGENAWSVVIEGFEPEGYVKDDDADKLDAAKMLAEIQEGQREANEERKREGFPELEILGWAMPPTYDRAAKKLTWALDLKVIGSERRSVNFYIRVLGRRGHLVLNALGGADQMGRIEAAAPQVLSMVEFNEGHRYADFDPKKGDKVATYGIAGLILGAAGLKLAAKAGLLAILAKKFGVVLLFAKKFLVMIIAAVVGLSAKIRGFIAGKRAGRDVSAGPEA